MLLSSVLGQYFERRGSVRERVYATVQVSHDPTTLFGGRGRKTNPP